MQSELRGAEPSKARSLTRPAKTTPPTVLFRIHLSKNESLKTGRAPDDRDVHQSLSGRSTSRGKTAGSYKRDIRIPPPLSMGQGPFLCSGHETEVSRKHRPAILKDPPSRSLDGCLPPTFQGEGRKAPVLRPASNSRQGDCSGEEREAKAAASRIWGLTGPFVF